jgi:hypothetical protein
MGKKIPSNLILPPAERKRQHGLYIDVAAIKKTSKAGRAITAIKQALRDWIGEGNVGAELILQRIAYKALRLSLYEASRFEDPDQSEAAHYLPMSNSLRLDIQAVLNMRESQGKPASYDEVVGKIQQAMTEDTEEKPHVSVTGN